MNCSIQGQQVKKKLEEIYENQKEEVLSNSSLKNNEYITVLRSCWPTGEPQEFKNITNLSEYLEKLKEYLIQPNKCDFTTLNNFRDNLQKKIKPTMGGKKKTERRKKKKNNTRKKKKHMKGGEPLKSDELSGLLILLTILYFITLIMTITCCPERRRR